MRVMELCQSVLEARQAADFNRALQNATGELSARFFSGFLASSPRSKAHERMHRSFGCPPAEFQGHKDREAAKRDPVIARCVQRPGIPHAWSQRDYAEAGQGDLWEEMAAFGMRRGFAVVTELPGTNRWFAFGIETDSCRDPSAEELSAQMAGFALVTAYAQVAAEAVLVPRPDHALGALSARQREVLKWTAAGKTAWEVGRILAISEGTVRRHLQDSAQTLNAVNKAHAVAMALEFGWI